MIPRIHFPWLFDLSQKSFLGLTVSLVLLSPVLGASKLYYSCQQNPLECTYGKGKYAAASSSSPSCTDRHPNCRDYAMRGNCIRNSEWMEAQCPLSCGICPTSTTAMNNSNNNDDDHDCIDHHPNCPKWASEQECFINPAFVNAACPMSCIRCVNATVVLGPSKKEEYEEEEDASSSLEQKAQVEARIRYLQTDFGVWQALPIDDVNLVPGTTQVLFDMGEYAQELLEEEMQRIRRLEQEDGEESRQLVPPLLGPSAVCNNMRHDCATLAAKHGCSSGPHLEMMLQECSFACRFCHETFTYHTCRSSSSSSTTSSSNANRISLENSTISKTSRSSISLNHHIWNHLSTKHGAINLAAAEASQTTTTTTKFQNEWVASLNYTALWNDDEAKRTTQQQPLRNQLLQVAMSAFQDDARTTCNDSGSDDDSRVFQRERGRGKSRTDTATVSGGRITTCNGPMVDPANVDKRDSTTTTTTTVSPLSSSCQDLEHKLARLLGIAAEYLEPLEFLHFGSTTHDDGSSTNYNKKKSYPRQVPMSEFDHHDQWKPSGHVLFTILVVLQGAERGGAIGFPDLDWLVVHHSQILVWPTSFTKKKGGSYYPQEMKSMQSEILPVIQGDLYAIKIHVRQYPYSYNPDCSTT